MATTTLTSPASSAPDTLNAPNTPSRATRSRSSGLGAFLLLSFGIAWACMFVARALGMSLVNPLVQLTFAFAPAIAGYAVRKWVTREGFGDAGLAPRLRAAWPHYLAAWLGPWALLGASLAVAAAAGLWQPSLAPLGDVVPGLPGWGLVLALLLVVPLLTPVYWGEEFGWTGYLRLRLLPHRPVLSTVLTGLVWAVWHYPLAFLGYIEFDNVALGLLVWTVSFLFQEFLLSWLRIRGGSIWLPSLAHAGNNMVLSLLAGALLTGGAGLGVMAVTLITAVPMAVLTAFIVLSGRFSAARASAGPR